MNPSTKDEIKGTFHEVKGKVKETVGHVTNNPNLEVEGQAEQTTGKVEKKVGQIEKVVEKSVRQLRPAMFACLAQLVAAAISSSMLQGRHGQPSARALVSDRATHISAAPANHFVARIHLLVRTPVTCAQRTYV
jgi:uncharacterized protein YjbJ (UPF0337 family)